MHDESGPQPYSPYQIPANSEHPAFGGGTFQTPSSTQLNTSGSKGLVQSYILVLWGRTYPQRGAQVLVNTWDPCLDPELGLGWVACLVTQDPCLDP